MSRSRKGTRNVSDIPQGELSRDRGRAAEDNPGSDRATNPNPIDLAAAAASVPDSVAVTVPDSVAVAGSEAAPVPVARQRTTREIIEEWTPRLAETLAGWQQSLPADAATTWASGAAYVRESSVMSLIGDAPDVQLRNVLSMLQHRQVYVAPDALFFEVQSGTDIAARAVFRRLFERAIAGGFKVIGVFLNERLFRNLEQATEIKRQFRIKGIELVYMGKLEGGDPRSPASWHFEVTQDTTAELHARNTGYYVGTHVETITRGGRPVGSRPEVYVVGERAPSFMNKRGSVTRWDVLEPLASVMKEGMQRYLAGASCSDLAAWSESTETRGVTPAGRLMDKMWWTRVLANPKYAGYHVPTQYTGFRPGKASPPRQRRHRDSELVECDYPALWSLEDHRAAVALASARFRGPKHRPTYRSYLLTGIAYDHGCGHKMGITDTRPRKAASENRFWMRCSTNDLTGYHSGSLRCDVAAQELDELIGMMELDDPELRALVEAELLALTQQTNADLERFQPNPDISRLRRAITALGSTDAQDVREDLERRIEKLIEADELKRESFSTPLVDFRAAMAHLENWNEVWRNADLGAKNMLLREAGIQVRLGRLPGDNKGVAHVLSISGENPCFLLALATALVKPVSTLDTQHEYEQPNQFIWGKADPGLLGVARRTLGQRHDIALALPRPVFPYVVGQVMPTRRRHEVTIDEAAEATGVSSDTIKKAIKRGAIKSRRAKLKKRIYVYVSKGDYDYLRSLEKATPTADEITVAEHVAQTGIARHVVYARIASGEIKARRVERGGRSYLFVQRPQATTDAQPLFVLPSDPDSELLEAA